MTDIVVGLVAGLVVAGGSLSVQANLDDQRSEREALRENLRFVRERALGTDVTRPFRFMNLTGQNLSGLELPDADFSGATLVGVNLAGADLTGAKLGDADLSGANLINARLDKAGLVRANFTDADLTGATLDAETGGLANYSGANLRGAFLLGASFGSHPNSLAVADRDMTGIVLSDANLENADLRGKQLAGASIRRANLRGANLTGADLRAEGAVYPQRFEPGGAPMFMGGNPVDLTGSDLSGITLDSICYDSSTRWPAGFVPPPSTCSTD